MSKMLDVANSGRLVQLKELLLIISRAIDSEPGARDLAQLCKQYRDTIKEIDEIEGNVKEDDEISEILGKRDAAGKSKPVRKNRAAVPRK